MIVTYHGGSCVRLAVGEHSAVFNPPAKASSRFSTVRATADAVLVSMWHQDFNGVENVRGAKRDQGPFVVAGPGAYEVGELSVHGFGMETEYDGVTRYNTIYQVHFAHFNIVHLGALREVELDSHVRGALGDIDILFIPVGGDEVLDASDAARVMVKLEPRVTIPVHYDNTTLAAFLKETGAEGVAPESKWSVKHKEIGALEGAVRVLIT